MLIQVLLIDFFHRVTVHLEALHVSMELDAFQARRYGLRKDLYSLILSGEYGGHSGNLRISTNQVGHMSVQQSRHSRLMRIMQSYDMGNATGGEEFDDPGSCQLISDRPRIVTKPQVKLTLFTME